MLKYLFGNMNPLFMVLCCAVLCACAVLCVKGSQIYAHQQLKGKHLSPSPLLL